MTGRCPRRRSAFAPEALGEWSLVRRLAAGLVLASTALAWAQSLPSATPAAPETAPRRASRPVLTRPQIDRLVTRLAHPQFRIRESASQSLSEASPDSLGLLLEAYHAQPAHELKLRLRAAIENVFYQKFMEGRIGFLGVGPRVEANVFQPATGKTVDAILIARVLAGFPAEKAGLKVGDVLVEFDGRSVADIMAARQPPPAAPVQAQAPGQIQIRVGGQIVVGAQQIRSSSDAQITAFTREVARRDPGTAVSIRLLRCRTADRELDLPIPDQPFRALDGANLVATTVPNLQAAINELLGPSSRLGLFVGGVTADSPAARAGLKAGDVIVGVGRDFSASTAVADQLATELEAGKADGKVRLRLSRVEEVKLTVTLGDRPVDRMNLGDMEIAQNNLADWWRAQTGESSFRDRSRPAFFPVFARPGGDAQPNPTVLP
ncbi:MAG: PDZ domain-containing protein [Planctomycetes bacterium]|nr:PDZ domain-containing protein [Planctomycetota bacterium]